MAVRSKVTTVDSSRDIIAGPFRRHANVVVRNQGAAEVFLGGDDVTTGNGFSVAATTTVPNTIPLPPGETLYGVCATSTTVHTLATGAD